MQTHLAFLFLLLAGGALHGASLDGDLRNWLQARFPDGMAAVNQVDSSGVRTVVHVFLRQDARDPTDQDAAELVQGLQRDVLARSMPGKDFAPGSQFLMFAPGQLEISGAGRELRLVLEELARAVVDDVGRMGLGVQRIAVSGFGGPMAAVELRARGINLGEAGRLAAQRSLQRHIREVIFGERYPWVAFLGERSRIEVTDLQLHESTKPTGWRYDPSREIVGRPVPGGPPPLPTKPVPAIARAPVSTPEAAPKPEPALVTVHFDSDRAELRPGDRAHLRGLIAERDPRQSAAVVVGHADSRNTREYNKALGLRRARNVGSFLRELGVPPTRLEMHSHGEDRPIVPNDTPENMQRNRRALVQVLD